MSVSFLKRSKIKNLLTCCQKFIGLNKAAKNSKNCCLLSRPYLTLSPSPHLLSLYPSIYLSHPLSHLLTYNTLSIFLPLLYNISLTTSHTPTLSFPFSLPQTNGITFSDSKSVSLKTFFSIFVEKKIDNFASCRWFRVGRGERGLQKLWRFHDDLRSSKLFRKVKRRSDYL